MQNQKLKPNYNSYVEFLLDEYYEKYALHNNQLYLVKKQDVDPFKDIFISKRLSDNAIMVAAA